MSSRDGRNRGHNIRQAEQLIAEVSVALDAGQEVLDDQLPALNKALGEEAAVELLDRATWNEKNGLGLATPPVNKAWLVNGAHVHH